MARAIACAFAFGAAFVSAEVPQEECTDGVCEVGDMDDDGSALQVKKGAAEAEASVARFPGSRLIVRNGCDSQPMWIASMVRPEDRHLFPNNFKLNPGQEYTFQLPADRTVASTRFWPKMGCREDGTQCRMGSSGGPGQDCPPKGCAPPVDSKFEATFGDKNTAEPVDWWDTSGVDGYTVPYKLELDEGCPNGKSLDCSQLALSDCPRDEVLNNQETDLFVKYQGDGEVVGCYSHCGKLTFDNWGNEMGRHMPWSDESKMYCCPTPPVSSEACRQGPVEQTKFVKLFREKCMGVYSYAYDDAIGLQTCPVGTAYTWTLLCPESGLNVDADSS